MKAFLLLVTSGVFVGPAFAAPPNVIVVFSDDHGYADLGCQGILDDVRTPHIDALAARGVRMTSGYVTAPQCVPSRGGLITGQYQNKFGLESNIQFGEPGGLDGFNRALTIAERLKKVDYVTGMAGKWHLGPDEKISSHGFDKVYRLNSNGPGFANFDLDGNDVPPGRTDSDRYHIDVCTAAACAFIKRYRDRPFFFYLAYRAPHVPLDPPQKYLKRFPGDMPERRRKALAMLAAVDDGVGAITATLEQLDIDENTLLFFIGDNGAPLKIHKADEPGNGAGWDGSLNDPLNGEKGMLSEGGIRVPFVVSWKGRIPGGQVYSKPVISLDVAATVCSAAGLDADAELDGVDLLPYLTGHVRDEPHEALYWRWVGQSAVRKGKWKYIAGGGREYLFDLEADIGESKNVVKRHPEIANKLRADLDRWSQTLQPPGRNGPLSRAAEQYFDWYLDGKRDAARPATDRSQREPGRRGRRAPSARPSQP